MLTIMEVEARPDGGHGMLREDNRTECWLDGWIAVPPQLEQKAWDCGGYCRLVVRDGVLEEVKPIDRPPEGKEIPSIQDDVDTMLVDHEYRLTLLELGVNECCTGP